MRRRAFTLHHTRPRILKLAMAWPARSLAMTARSLSRSPAPARRRMSESAPERLRETGRVRHARRDARVPEVTAERQDDAAPVPRVAAAAE